MHSAELYEVTQIAEAVDDLEKHSAIESSVRMKNLLRQQNALLIIGNDVLTCNLYQQLFTEIFPDYTIHIANDRSTALHLLTERVPELIVLDLALPDRDGFTVLQSIRAVSATSKVPVLVLSEQPLVPEDVQKLNYINIIFQSKDILSPDELKTLFKHVLTGSRLAPQTSILIKSCIAYLQHYYASNLTLPEVAAKLGISKRHLTRIMLQELGMSPWEYLNRYRLKKARELLRNTPESISTIATQVGFDDPAYFSRIFRQHTGCSPSMYRDQKLISK